MSTPVTPTTSAMPAEPAAAAPDVTVILPSLNVATYIRPCVESVLAQTLANIEVICVDAGSTDGTLEALREFEARDSRVRVIVSDKRSYGHQMNLGLKAARGAYLGIVETDDWVDPVMYERLFALAQEHDADLVKSNYYLYREEPAPQNDPCDNLAGCPLNEPFTPSDSVAMIDSAPAIWSCLYRREMLEEQALRFTETPGASYQDASFWLMACTVAKRAVATGEAFYHYRQDNEASSVNTVGKVWYVSDEVHRFEGFLRGRGLEGTDVHKRCLPTKFRKYRWNYRRVAPESQWPVLKAACQEFRAHEAAGLLDESLFTPEDWQELQHLLRNPRVLWLKTRKPGPAHKLLRSARRRVHKLRASQSS